MNPRFRAIEQILSRPGPSPLDQSQRPSDAFGRNVFSKKMMKQYLSGEAYKELIKTIEAGKTLDRNLAGPVANGIKAWALDRGVTHYTHWFQPLTGRTAEKHDSFLELSEGEVLDKFGGEELSQQEPDVSTLPTGGLRRTFEARGYTAWDCTSPIFISESRYGKTLFIPTILVAYTGEALDYKMPLLKSTALIDKAATEVCQLFDPSVKRVFPYLGIEQEYFLIDESLFELRPDLVLSGRTLIGDNNAGIYQQAGYLFGGIPERVFAFMNELERECHSLGIPIKTRHNEFAPGQFECAPQFESLNVAVDHGLLLMDLIDRMARRHHFRALLHEKPFSGINGSGKHNSWSLHTDTGINLLSPGKDPIGNLMFLAFFMSVIKGVSANADLLRASIASAGNDLRLGTEEAPPPLVSVFIGKFLKKIVNDIENPPRRRRNASAGELMHLGISEIPEILLDNTDRNRTSPFAFTGNKFEFRQVGAAANSSAAMTILNTIASVELRYFARRVTSKMNRGRNKEAALLDMIREYIQKSRHILFEGDNYSEEWEKEARNRKLNRVDHTPDALDAFLSKDAFQLYEKTSLFTEREIRARYQVKLEQYCIQLRLEAEVLLQIISTQVIPAAISFQNQLLKNLTLAEQAAFKHESSYTARALAGKTGKLTNELYRLSEKLREQVGKTESISEFRKKASEYASLILPLCQDIRSASDELENLIPDELWPLPRYRELLFVR